MAVQAAVQVDREQAFQVVQVSLDKVKTAARQHQAHLTTAVQAAVAQSE
jgi:hypothetical protein